MRRSWCILVVAALGCAGRAPPSAPAPSEGEGEGEGEGEVDDDPSTWAFVASGCQRLLWAIPDGEGAAVAVDVTPDSFVSDEHGRRLEVTSSGCLVAVLDGRGRPTFSTVVEGTFCGNLDRARNGDLIVGGAVRIHRADGSQQPLEHSGDTRTMFERDDGSTLTGIVDRAAELEHRIELRDPAGALSSTLAWSWDPATYWAEPDVFLELLDGGVVVTVSGEPAADSQVPLSDGTVAPLLDAQYNFSPLYAAMDPRLIGRLEPTGFRWALVGQSDAVPLGFRGAIRIHPHVVAWGSLRSIVDVATASVVWEAPELDGSSELVTIDGATGAIEDVRIIAVAPEKVCGLHLGERLSLCLLDEVSGVVRLFDLDGPHDSLNTRPPPFTSGPSGLVPLGTQGGMLDERTLSLLHFRPETTAPLSAYLDEADPALEVPSPGCALVRVALQE